MNVLNVFKVVYITTAFDRHNGTVESRSYMGKKLAIHRHINYVPATANICEPTFST